MDYLEVCYLNEIVLKKGLWFLLVIMVREHTVSVLKFLKISLRLVVWLRLWSALVNILCTFKKNVYSVIDGYRIK